MKMKHLFMMSLVALVAMAMTSCLHVKIGDKDWSIGDGHKNDTPTQVHQVQQVTEMQPFEKVNLAGPIDVILEQGESHTVRVEATTEQLEKMTIYVENGGLYVDQRKSEPGKTFDGVKVFVSLPMIKGLSIAGSGDVTVPKALNVADMGISIAGTGDVTIAQLKCHDLGISIAGTGDVTMGPVLANEVKCDVAGTGDVDFAGLTCMTLHNSIAGTGDMTFNNLDVEHVTSSIAGMGDVILRGKAGSHKESVAGLGKVDVTGLTQK